MFVYFTKEDGTKRHVNTNLIEGIEVNCICLIEGFYQLTHEQYGEIMAQLEALGLLYKPSEPMPPVGEPLREIVGEAFQNFMNTKGRTD